MARIKRALLICGTCGAEFQVEGNKAIVRCDKCGFVQTIVLDHERIGTAFLKVREDEGS